MNAIMCAIQNDVDDDVDEDENDEDENDEDDDDVDDVDERPPLDGEERERMGGFSLEDVALLPGIKVMSMGSRH